MPLGVVRSQGSSGEYLNHCVGIRMRVVGSGNLRLTLYSPDSLESDPLTAIPMAVTTRSFPHVLANFTQYRFQLEGDVNVENEYFRVNRLVFYSKVTATMEPM